MGVVYVPIDGERVSREWGVVLADMRAAKVPFRVNEGHRTWARQAYFYALYRSGRGNLAAKPSNTAPHIRTGRLDHAIDFWNADDAIDWLRTHGLRAKLTVPGESWHVEVPAEDLREYSAKHPADPVIRPHFVKPFRRNDKEAVRKLQGLLAGRGFHSVKKTGRYDLATRKAVRRFQHTHGLKADGVVGPSTWRALRR